MPPCASSKRSYPANGEPSRSGLRGRITTGRRVVKLNQTTVCHRDGVAFVIFRLLIERIDPEELL